jgi:mono/diheme cytochrome c family protein
MTTIGVLGATAVLGQPEASPATGGSHLFRTYCAACHGTSARGDGPLADSFRRRPADLTTIAKRAGGVFPAAQVFRIIDGRQRVPGHGGPDMPVWGDAFKRSVLVADEASVKRRIEQLVSFLETIQERTANE